MLASMNWGKETLSMLANRPLPMAHGMGHQRIMQTSRVPFSRMTRPNASHCLFGRTMPGKKRLVSAVVMQEAYETRLTRTDKKARPAPPMLLMNAISVPGHMPNAKPMSVMLALKPKRGGWDVKTEGQAGCAQ